MRSLHARISTRALHVASIAVVTLAALLPTALVRSQDAGPAPALLAPELIEDSPPSYTEEATAARVEGEVVLRLTIDAQGQVTEAEVLEGLGHGLDEAAREAALRMRFRPAMRAGTPIVARIAFRVSFRLPAPPPLGSATVRVVDGEGAFVPEVEVTLSRESGELVASGVTTADGSVELTDLPPGAYRARATRGSWSADVALEVTGGQTASAELTFVPPAESPPVAAPVAAPVEVMVRGQRSEARQLVESAEAVTVVELRRAREQSADLGEVMARTQGVAVRRSGGLGTSTRFSLNGLYDDQIRFFLDGVPLDSAGYPFGIANVPVNLLDRVEIYRGVVPVRFGADALGGAVNLVSGDDSTTGLGASLQAGSFGLYRVSVDGRYLHEESGFVGSAALFIDAAQNDYEIDVEVPDARGRLFPARVRRFHDDYLAYGATLEVGLVNQPWGRRLLLGGFVSTYDKDLQHNVVMTVPYGEVTFGETVYGGTARYEHELVPGLELTLLANYARRTIDFVDRGEWVYDWFGQRIRERRVAGEIQSDPTDNVIWQDSGLARATLEWAPLPEHVFRLALTPAYTTRTGDERIQSDPAARDPLTARRELFTFVSGLEYELNLFPTEDAPAESEERTSADYILQNSFFVKSYFYLASSEEVLPGNIFRERRRESSYFGIGDGLRVRITDWLIAKASYEFATRLPRPDEVFGNGVLIIANLGLEPEVSHNFNLGPRVELRRTPVGDVIADVNFFVRESDRLIVLLGNDRVFSYQNVYRARGIGVESALAWTSPGRWVSADGTFTFQDVVNASSEGTFADFEGDRIPNRPWLFASWGARVRIPDLPQPTDTLEAFYAGRYVHEFFRGWESQGLREFKQSVASQLTHTLGVSYTVSRDEVRLTTTFEVQNVTDEAVFDFFGVQRPGRAFYLKVTGEI